MHYLIALLAGCVLHPPTDDPCKEARAAQAEFLRSHGAEVAEWNLNGTVRIMKATGIYLPPGVADLKIDQPAPRILEAIGPALLARGTEELRVRFISRQGAEIVVKLDEFMQGREVAYGGVNVAVNEQTNQVTGVWAYFMPDRGLEHVPQLFADDAKAKAGTTIRASLEQRGMPDTEVTFGDSPAYLRYEFEEMGSEAGGGVNGGALVWVLSADVKPDGWCQVMVDAATGKVVRIYAPPPHDP
jgi:hypothetical protein